ncbi:MAG: hypothetical protein EA421_13470 [Gemmatimonadales bacterium]|nr:MAG: hypothetical protein EA421_13470 [Gemmatimonadales bacterium]
MSRSYEAGFTITKRSKVRLRAVYPRPFTRISYQVGSPWMLEGKRLDRGFSMYASVKRPCPTRRMYSGTLVGPALRPPWGPIP